MFLTGLACPEWGCSIPKKRVASLKDFVMMVLEKLTRSSRSSRVRKVVDMYLNTLNCS